MRDIQKSSVYQAEWSLIHVMDRAYDYPTVEVYGSRITVSPDRKFADIESVKRYTDAVMGMNWVKGLWPNHPPVKVRTRKGSRAAHHQTGTIAIPVMNEGRWAMREIVILHELAHYLSPVGEHHGSVFAGNLLYLIENAISPENALIFQSFLNENGAAYKLP